MYEKFSSFLCSLLGSTIGLNSLNLAVSSKPILRYAKFLKELSLPKILLLLRSTQPSFLAYFLKKLFTSFLSIFSYLFLAANKVFGSEAY